MARATSRHHRAETNLPHRHEKTHPSPGSPPSCSACRSAPMTRRSSSSPRGNISCRATARSIFISTASTENCAEQLTTDAGQDDKHPQFSHDGKSVLFTRTTSGAGLPNQSGNYILQLADGTMKAAPDAALADYTPTVPTTEYGDLAFLRSPARRSLPRCGQGRLCFCRTGPCRHPHPDQQGRRGHHLRT